LLTKNVLSSLLLITLLVGCDSDDSENEKEHAPESLVGVWSSACIADDSDPGGEESDIFNYEFTETEVIIKNTNYSDLVCGDVFVVTNLYGTYEIGEHVLTPTGVNATEIDLIITETSRSPDNKVTSFNTTFFELFVVEDTYLYMGDDSDDDGGDRPTDISFSSWLELQK
jgi:hypothetical protein